MRVIVKDVNYLTPEEYKYCYNANLHSSDKSEGRMRPDLAYYRRDPLTAIEEDAKVILLWDDEKEGARRLLGWALTFSEGGTDPIAFFWVKKPFRNKGLGTIMMKEVKNIHPRPKVYPWSIPSGGFFSKFDVETPKHNASYLVKKPIVC
jgi:hypothetical protein